MAIWESSRPADQESLQAVKYLHNVNGHERLSGDILDSTIHMAQAREGLQVSHVLTLGLSMQTQAQAARPYVPQGGAAPYAGPGPY